MPSTEQEEAAAAAREPVEMEVEVGEGNAAEADDTTPPASPRLDASMEAGAPAEGLPPKKQAQRDGLQVFRKDCYRSYAAEGFRSLDPGVWFWPVLLLVPSAFLALLFGVVPLGEPESQATSEWWTFAFVVTPVVYGMVCYYKYVFFLFCVAVDRPFRARWLPILLVAGGTGAVTAITWASTSSDVPPRLWGAIMLLSTLILSLGGVMATEIAVVPREERHHFKAVYSAYMRTEAVMAVLLSFVILYIFAYRYSDSAGQTVLPLNLAVVTYLCKKAMLKVTEPFPLEQAMFVSGFVVENAEDMFSVMAFPSVISSRSLISVWAVPTLSNLALLFFLTDRWFRFRLWIKEAIKRAVCCGRRGLVRDIAVEPDYSDLPDDRGYATNQPGYARRQARFYLWKTFSQAMAMVFYLAVAPLLRWGTNSDQYPFTDSEGFGKDEYLDSIQFAVGNLVSAVVSAAAGVWYISTRYPDLWAHMQEKHSRLLVHHTFVGFLVLTVVTNGVVATSIMLRHNQVWFGFND